MAMLGASCSPCCAACTCGANGAVDPWRPLTRVTAPITDPYQEVSLNHLNMYPELCCFGYSTAPTLEINVSGGTGTTTQYLRNMSGTYVTQGFSYQQIYRLFDTRWSVSNAGTVPGFRREDNMFESELPLVGADFTGYWAYPGSRRTVLEAGVFTRQWYYSDGHWIQLPIVLFDSGANDANPPPYSKTETATACGCIGYGKVIDRVGQPCVQRPTITGDGAYTELSLYLTRRVASTDAFLDDERVVPYNWTDGFDSFAAGKSISSAALFDDRLAELDRSNTCVYVRVTISIYNELGCQFPAISNLRLVWEGESTSADPCSLSFSSENLRYLGHQAIGRSTSQINRNYDYFTNIQALPTVSVSTL